MPKKLSLDYQIQYAYFENEKDLSTLDADTDECRAFYKLADIATKYNRVPEQEKERLIDEAALLVAQNPTVTQYYTIFPNGRQDLAVYALNFKAFDLAALFIEGEALKNRNARERNDAWDTQYNGAHDYGNRNDDDEDTPQPKTQKQKALLLMMFAQKENTFGLTNDKKEADLALKFIEELKLNPHQQLSFILFDKEVKTTPFMYFLHKHYVNSAKTYASPIVPQSVSSSFYGNADFEVKDFNNDNLYCLAFMANQYNLADQLFDRIIQRHSQQKAQEMKLQAEQHRNGVEEEKTKTQKIVQHNKMFTPDLPNLFAHTRE